MLLETYTHTRSHTLTHVFTTAHTYLWGGMGGMDCCDFEEALLVVTHLHTHTRPYTHAHTHMHTSMYVHTSHAYEQIRWAWAAWTATSATLRRHFCWRQPRTTSARRRHGSTRTAALTTCSRCVCVCVCVHTCVYVCAHVCVCGGGEGHMHAHTAATCLHERAGSVDGMRAGCVGAWRGGALMRCLQVHVHTTHTQAGGWNTHSYIFAPKSAWESHTHTHSYTDAHVLAEECLKLEEGRVGILPYTHARCT